MKYIIKFIILLFPWCFVTAQSVNKMPGYALLPMKNVSEVMMDDEGYMWYALYGGGVCRYNGYQMDVFKSDYRNNMLIGESNTVVKLLEDKNGNICFGTHRGAYVLKKKDFRVMPIDTMLIHNRVRNMCITANGTLWIDSELGTFAYDRNYHRLHHTSVPTADLFSNNASNGRISYAQRPSVGKITRYDGKYVANGFSIDDLPQSLCDTLTKVSCVTIGTDGLCYVGDVHGLIVYNTKTGKAHRAPVVHDNVRGLAKRSRGGIYFISASKGLGEYTPDGNVRIIGGTGFFQIASDIKGHVWTSDLYGGVWRCDINDGTLAIDKEASSRNGEMVKDMVTDEYGHLWFVTENLMQEYIPDKHKVRLLTVTNRNIMLPDFRSIVREGLNMVLTSDSAYVTLSTADSHGSDRSTKVCSIKVDDEMHFLNSGSNSIEIPANATVVELFLSTLDFTNSQDTYFSYRIGKGEWNMLRRGENIISLINLSKGTYTIEVRATDKMGWMSETATRFTLKKLPHWYETWWAYSLYAIAIVTIMLLIMRNQRQKSMLNLRIRNLIDELERSKNIPKERLLEISIIDNTIGKTESTAKDNNELDKHNVVNAEFLQQATQCVERNLNDTDYKIERFAADMSTSRAGLYRKFEEADIEVKPNEFIRTVRLRHACRLLKTGEYTVAEIAYRVGFSSPSYFNRCFKDVYGVQPLQYKEQ